MSETLKDYIPLVVNTLLGLLLVALDERELGVGVIMAAATGRGLTMAVDQTRSK